MNFAVGIKTSRFQIIHKFQKISSDYYFGPSLCVIQDSHYHMFTYHISRQSLDSHYHMFCKFFSQSGNICVRLVVFTNIYLHAD